ncbi:MAG: RnfABCDGE type electron transport complex subunit D [Clostridia bacterium]|nr:RnfABCDGE type electron transport complex subunit D [Clostridia bacterium]
MNMTLNLSAAPHARDRWTTPFIMRMVTLSLLPATIVGILVYGWNAFGIVALAVASAVAAEWLFCKACKMPSTIWDGSAVVTGLLLALSLGPQTPLYIPVIGSVFAIVVCKGCFGGLGKNFINPALAARCFLLISFANAMAIKPVVDAVASATPVGAMKAGEAVDITKMFLGTADGVIGSSILALLAGGLLLWSLDIIHGQICFSVLIGFTLFLGLFGDKGFDPAYLLAHLCGGGVVMGAFFMATDYVTSPVSRLGQFIYGCLIGVLGGLFRLKGNTADSFSYAIIIGNVCTPLIDTYIVQKPFAYRKMLGKTHKTSKEPFRIPKPVIALTLIAALAGVALSGVYSMTKDTIEEQKLLAEAASYKEVCPDADHFESSDAAKAKLEELAGANWGTEFGNTRINEAFVGKDASGNLAGYALSVSSKGFGGDVTMALGLTPDGAVNRISFTELNETAGLGMRANEDAFRDQFSGKTGSITYGEDGVEAMSGATVTSTAVKNCVNAGLNFYETVLKGGN